MSCYQIERVQESAEGLRELASPAFEHWLARLARGGACRILIGLVLKLERMAQINLKPARRLALMHRLVPAVRDVADELPKTPGPPPGVNGSPGERLCLEQRLICLTVRNLKRTLADLDGAEGVNVPGRDAARLWVLQALMDCLGRQVELAARWEKPWPRQTWQELHDLYAYFIDRVRPTADVAEARAVASAAFDLELAYKRLLVVGLLKKLEADELLQEAGPERLTAWARDSRLLDSTADPTARGSYAVEMSSDAPPWRNPSVQESVRRTMILRLAREPVAAMESLARGKPVFFET